MSLFDLLFFIAAGYGFAAGITTGLHYPGIPGAIGGAILGLIFGAFIGRLPFMVGVRWVRWRLGRLSSEQLRDRLTQEPHISHFVLAELIARGEDASQHLPAILDLLTANSPTTRRFGYRSLCIVYPEESKALHDYEPGESTDRCREKVARLPTGA